MSWKPVSRARWSGVGAAPAWRAGRQGKPGAPGLHLVKVAGLLPDGLDALIGEVDVDGHGLWSEFSL